MEYMYVCVGFVIQDFLGVTFASKNYWTRGSGFDSLAQGFVHGLVHLVLTPEMILHQFFSNKGFFADRAQTRTVFLKVDC